MRAGSRVSRPRILRPDRRRWTPFITFFMPAELLAMAKVAGFRDVQHVPAATPIQR
jgi:hypothetical protein